MTTRERKLLKEAAYAVKNPLPLIEYGPVNDRMDHWKGVLTGPEDSVYYGTEVCVDIKLEQAYPFVPPVMKSEVYHPNVYGDTKIVCMSLLHEGEDPFGYERPDERWSPAKSIAQLLLAFQQILINPNLESPANIPAASAYARDKERFQKIVRDRFIRKQQDVAYEKCLQDDREKLKARKRHIVEEDVQGKRFKEDDKRDFYKEILPVEPTEDEDKIVLKLRKKENSYVRSFSPSNSVMSIFDFLSSQGVTSSKLVCGKINIYSSMGSKLIRDVLPGEKRSCLRVNGTDDESDGD